MKEILQTLADRVSRKAILLMTGMILIYMIVITPTVVHALWAIAAIVGLSLIGVFLQFVIDLKRDPNKVKKLEEEGKD